MSFRQAFNQDNNEFQPGDHIQNIETDEVVRIDARWYTFTTKSTWYSLSNGKDIDEAELKRSWTPA